MYCDDQDDDNKPIQEFVQVSAFGAQEANAEDAFATNSLPFNFCDPYDIEDLQVLIVFRDDDPFKSLTVIYVL